MTPEEQINILREALQPLANEPTKEEYRGEGAFCDLYDEEMTAIIMRARRAMDLTQRVETPSIH